MRKPLQGMALITVLMLSVVLLLVVLTGIQLSGRNLFTMSRAHDRNMALYAAEAGIYKTMAEIETLDRYPDSGLRPGVTLENGASYQVQLDRVGEVITLRSEGRAPRASRTLEVTLTVSPESFFAVTTEGPIGLADDVFVNGVQSTSNPKPKRGHLHTNSGDPAAIVRELTSPSAGQRLSVTGEATSVGGIRATIEGKSRTSADYINPLNVDRNSLLGTSPYTQISALPNDGVIRGHVRIDSADWEGPLHIEEGSVLHVTGDLALAHGVTGSGTLVVDGETLIRGSEDINLANPRGVFLYGGGGVSLVHPQAQRETLEINEFTPPTPTPEDPNPQPRPTESRETFHHEPDPVSSFFAGRPVDTEFNLRQGLPLDAPTDLEFFEYYERQALEPSEAFRLWLDGDESIQYPGVRPEVKQWLEKSRNDPKIRTRLREMKTN
ncbi:hypothetical protein IV102_36715 [bacterium]|nr:hypothetical protein [bacterium]